MSDIDDAIDDNADIADAILSLALDSFGLAEQTEHARIDWHDQARPLDLNKAHSTIKQFWRDWSKEGFEAEVEPLLRIILDDLGSYLSGAQDIIRVLLPGAGLGRLLFELCLAGYETEGNEISYHQLMASNFILNTTTEANQYKLYPFINSFNNHLSRGNQLRGVTIPDVHPATAMAEKRAFGAHIGEMSMSAGDFTTSYSSSQSTSSFDAVVTVYFIDTAPNVIRYIEAIHHCLREGGLWINIGPLLWHFEDRMLEKHDVKQDKEEEDDVKHTNRDVTGIAEPGSFELTDGEVMSLVQGMGFEILVHSKLPPEYGGYIQDPESMLQHIYHCSHWVARKMAKS